MKRMISIMLAATLLALTFCGCGEAQNTKQVKVSVVLVDDSHELKENLVASANKSFSKPISHSGRWKNGGKYDYAFDVPEKLDTLYTTSMSVRTGDNIASFELPRYYGDQCYFLSRDEKSLTITRLPFHCSEWNPSEVFSFSELTTVNGN